MNGKEIREFLRFLKDNDASNAFIMSYRKAKFYDDEPMNEYLYSIRLSDVIISGFDWDECMEIKIGEFYMPNGLILYQKNEYLNIFCGFTNQCVSTYF